MKCTLGVALGLAALLCGCSHTEKSADAGSSTSYKLMESAPMSAPINASPPEAKGDDKEATADVLPGPRPYTETMTAPSRLLIYHADLRLKVASLPRANAHLDSLVQHSGGYLSSATEVRADGEWR